jgi:hypothetical protein
VRRNGDVSAGFGYRRFNTEMQISRQNMPLPPPPVASRNGRAFLRTATGGSASDSDPAAPDGADSDSSGSTQPAQKKPTTSLVEGLRFERPGRRSLEVMSEEVTGGSHSLVVWRVVCAVVRSLLLTGRSVMTRVGTENGELRPSMLHDQPSPRLPNSESTQTTATDQPASPRAANPSASSAVPAIRRRPSDAAARGSNNMLSAYRPAHLPRARPAILTYLVVFFAVCSDCVQEPSQLLATHEAVARNQSGCHHRHRNRRG